MTDTRDDVSDIAWMRALAEEGARAPIRGTSILMAAGLIYGVSSLLHWAFISDLLPGDETGTGWIWLAATALFLGVNAVIAWRLRGQAGTRTVANRAIATAWVGVGWGIFTLFASVAIAELRLGSAQEGYAILWLVPSIILVFYGVGWAVTAAMAKARPLWWLAIGSFVAAPGLAAFAGSNDQYLAYAAALLGLMALPGFLLMRAANRA